MARAAAINEAIAGALVERAVTAGESDHRAHGSAWRGNRRRRQRRLRRAHRIAFYIRRGRTPRDAAELSADARELSDDERAQAAALAVAGIDFDAFNADVASGAEPPEHPQHHPSPKHDDL